MIFDKEPSYKYDIHFIETRILQKKLDDLNDTTVNTYTLIPNITFRFELPPQIYYEFNVELIEISKDKQSTNIFKSTDVLYAKIKDQLINIANKEDYTMDTTSVSLYDVITSHLEGLSNKDHYLVKDFIDIDIYKELINTPTDNLFIENEDFNTYLENNSLAYVNKIIKNRKIFIKRAKISDIIPHANNIDDEFLNTLIKLNLNKDEFHKLLDYNMQLINKIIDPKASISKIVTQDKEYKIETEDEKIFIFILLTNLTNDTPIEELSDQDLINKIMPLIPTISNFINAKKIPLKYLLPIEYFNSLIQVVINEYFNKYLLNMFKPISSVNEDDINQLYKNNLAYYKSKGLID